MDYTILRDPVESYYRSLVGSQGRGIGFGGGATGLRMQDIVFVIPATFHIFQQENFEDKTILVDWKTFIDCDFKNCILQYGGGNGL